MPTIVDLTHPLVSGNVLACPGHPNYQATLTFSLAAGEFANVHTLTLGSHTGTHIDAPYHFYMDGRTVDQLDLSLLAAAPVVIIDLRAKGTHGRIEWADLQPYAPRMREGVVVLLCTGWSAHWGKSDYSDHPYLDVEAARMILDTGVRVIGADTLSPDEFTPEGDTGRVHRLVLGHGGIIVENLTNLETLVSMGGENLVVSLLPLSLSGCDGSPVRAVAWQQERS